MAMRIACWIPVTDILRICNTYCFSTARMVAGTRLSVTLYVHSVVTDQIENDEISTACYNGKPEVSD